MHSYHLKLLIFYVMKNILAQEFQVSIIGKAYAKSVDNTKWHRTLNAHEAIISLEDFKKVQEKFIKSKKIDFSKGDSILSGLVTCEYCNRCLKLRKLSHSKSYYCSYNKLAARFGCKAKTYKEDDLLKIIYLIIKYQIEIAVDLQACFEKIKKEYIFKKDNLDKKLEHIKSQKKQFNINKKNLYESYKYEKISLENYNAIKEQYNIKLENIVQQERKIEQQKENILNGIKKDISFITDLIKCKEKNIITRELLDNFIENIYIYDTDKIKLKFESKYQNLLLLQKDSLKFENV